MQAPGQNVPLIQFLILALYILFACLYRVLPHLSFFFTFPPFFYVENRPAVFLGQML